MTDRLVWLLDVDGVINATKAGWGAAPKKAHVLAPSSGRSFRLAWEPEVVTRIRQLHNSGLVEVRWCTTWCDDADQLERLWGLPVLARTIDVSTDKLWRQRTQQKIDAALDVAAAGHPLIWTDDEVVPDSGSLHTVLTAAGRGLLIRPKASRGLRPDHFDQINGFIARLNGGSPA